MSKNEQTGGDSLPSQPEEEKTNPGAINNPDPKQYPVKEDDTFTLVRRGPDGGFVTEERSMDDLATILFPDNPGYVTKGKDKDSKEQPLNGEDETDSSDDGYDYEYVNREAARLIAKKLKAKDYLMFASILIALIQPTVSDKAPVSACTNPINFYDTCLSAEICTSVPSVPSLYDVMVQGDININPDANQLSGAFYWGEFQYEECTLAPFDFTDATILAANMHRGDRNDLGDFSDYTPYIYDMAVSHPFAETDIRTWVTTLQMVVTSLGIKKGTCTTRTSSSGEGVVTPAATNIKRTPTDIPPGIVGALTVTASDTWTTSSAFFTYQAIYDAMPYGWVITYGGYEVPVVGDKAKALNTTYTDRSIHSFLVPIYSFGIYGWYGHVHEVYDAVESEIVVSIPDNPSMYNVFVDGGGKVASSAKEFYVQYYEPDYTNQEECIPFPAQICTNDTFNYKSLVSSTAIVDHTASDRFTRGKYYIKAQPQSRRRQLSSVFDSEQINIDATMLTSLSDSNQNLDATITHLFSDTSTLLSREANLVSETELIAIRNSWYLSYVPAISLYVSLHANCLKTVSLFNIYSNEEGFYTIVDGVCSYLNPYPDISSPFELSGSCRFTEETCTSLNISTFSLDYIITPTCELLIKPQALMTNEISGNLGNLIDSLEEYTTNHLKLEADIVNVSETHDANYATILARITEEKDESDSRISQAYVNLSAINSRVQYIEDRTGTHDATITGLQSGLGAVSSDVAALGAVGGGLFGSLESLGHWSLGHTICNIIIFIWLILLTIMMCMR